MAINMVINGDNMVINGDNMLKKLGFVNSIAAMCRGDHLEYVQSHKASPRPPGLGSSAASSLGRRLGELT